MGSVNWAYWADQPGWAVNEQDMILFGRSARARGPMTSPKPYDLTQSENVRHALSHPSRRPVVPYSFAAPSTLLRSRSNVPSGRCPAFRASSTSRQSENPRVGRLRNVSSAAATASGPWRVRC